MNMLYVGLGAYPLNPSSYVKAFSHLLSFCLCTRVSSSDLPAQLPAIFSWSNCQSTGFLVLCEHVFFKSDCNLLHSCSLPLYLCFSSESARLQRVLLSLTDIFNWHFLSARKSKGPRTQNRPVSPPNESYSSSLISQWTRMRELERVRKKDSRKEGKEVRQNKTTMEWENGVVKTNGSREIDFEGRKR